MKSTICKSTLLLIAGGIFLSACDEPAPTLPQTPPATKPAEPEPAPRRPTTQQLEQGEWKTVAISVLPMTIRVPASWDKPPVADSNLLTLDGWSPNGTVQLRFSTRPPLTEENFQLFLNGARKAMDARGEHKMAFELRDKQGYRVLEQQHTEPRRTMLLSDENGNLVEREATPLTWKQLIFMKSESGYDSYELGFVDLSLEHYKQDEAFLKRVLDSLTYDAARKN